MTEEGSASDQVFAHHIVPLSKEPFFISHFLDGCAHCDRNMSVEKE